MIKILADTIGKWTLESNAKKSIREKEILNLSETRSAVLVFDITDLETYKSVMSLANAMKSNQLNDILIIGFNQETQIPEYINVKRVKVLSKKNLNWMGMPSDAFKSAYMNRQFDVLIDCVSQSSIPTNFILEGMDAKNKVGRDDTGCDFIYDLMIHSPSLKDYQQDVIHFLKMFNKN